MWPLARRHARSAPAALAGFLAAAGPLIVVDIVSYRLLTYLGAGFDLGLMFDLAGRNLGEMFAVSSSQVLALAAALVVAGLVAGALIWLVSRRASARLTAYPAYDSPSSLLGWCWWPRLP